MINIIIFSILVFLMLTLAWHLGYASAMNRAVRHIEDLEDRLDTDERLDLRKHVEDW